MSSSPATLTPKSTSFILPSPAQLREIAARQDAKEKEIAAARRAAKSRTSSGLETTTDSAENSKERSDAAELIQRNYRGYRSRREMTGMGISSSTRWLEALKEAQYRNSTRPRPRREATPVQPASPARQKWKHAGVVARRAGNDDTSDTEGEEGMSPQEMEEHRRKKREAKAEREKFAKTMGLEYWLEMVDLKHRYGSSLRRYHAVWQESGSKENFFYWLDYGDGKDVDLEERPRTRLEEEQIRYLSREERLRYLVNIDKQGLLCWAKNGQRITTSPEFKDSVDGIVPVESKTPTWREVTRKEQGKEEPDIDKSDADSDSDSVSGISVGSNEDASKYVNQDLHEAKGLQKLKHISAGSLMNDLLRKTTKKNTWIFVADTSFRLYIGIKQSGAFQHSSFLHGGRVLAAGLIRIKNGQPRRLDPLSGHYAPLARNFRSFVHNLEQAGADMSHISISRSYATLVGLETYLGAKRNVKKGEQKIQDMMHPEEAKKREEMKKDKSKSAEKERETLEKEERLKREQSIPTRLKKKIGIDDKEDSSTASRISTATGSRASLPINGADTR